MSIFCELTHFVQVKKIKRLKTGINGKQFWGGSRFYIVSNSNSMLSGLTYGIHRKIPEEFQKEVKEWQVLSLRRNFFCPEKMSQDENKAVLPRQQNSSLVVKKFYVR